MAYQTRVGFDKAVDPYAPLQKSVSEAGDLYMSLLDRQSERERLVKQDARQAEQDAMSKELYNRQIAESDRELDQRDRLGDYFSNRTFARTDADLLNRMRDETVDATKGLMAKYKGQFDIDKGIGSLLDSDEVSKEDKDRIRGMNTAFVQAPSWKENNVNTISREILREGLVDNPQDAMAIAGSLAGGQSIEEAVATAQASAKTQNELRKHESDNAKYELTRQDKAFDRARNKWRDMQAGSGSSGRTGYSSNSDLVDMYNLYGGIQGMKIGEGDEARFIKAADTVRTLFQQQGFAPPNDEELLQAASHTFSIGPGLFHLGFNRDRQVGSAEDMAVVIGKMRDNKTSGNVYPTLLDDLEGATKARREELLRVATAPPVVAHSRGEILAAANQRPIDEIRRLGGVTAPTRVPNTGGTGGQGGTAPLSESSEEGRKAAEAAKRSSINKSFSDVLNSYTDSAAESSLTAEVEKWDREEEEAKEAIVNRLSAYNMLGKGQEPTGTFGRDAMRTRKFLEGGQSRELDNILKSRNPELARDLITRRLNSLNSEDRNKVLLNASPEVQKLVNEPAKDRDGFFKNLFNFKYGPRLNKPTE